MIPVAHIVDCVAAAYQVEADEMISHRRSPEVLRSRHVAMLLARRLTGLSYADLGRLFGDRHHTTVMTACENLEAQERHDTALARELAVLARVTMLGAAAAAPVEAAMPRDCDPVAVAERLERHPTAAAGISANQIRALGAALLNARDEREQALRALAASEAEARHLTDENGRLRQELALGGLPAGSVAVPAGLAQALARFIAARRALAANVFTRAERASREAETHAFAALERAATTPEKTHAD